MVYCFTCADLYNIIKLTANSSIIKYKMTVYIKTKKEIEKMRIACKSAANVLDMITPYVKPNITTNQLNKICHNYITKTLNAIPAPLNYRGFPKSICTSINNQVCHGIPNDKPLKYGDIINIDITVIKNGYHGDTSKMFCIGEASIKAKRLVEISQECLYLGIKQINSGARLGDIGAVIQNHANYSNLSVVRDYCGHGIGKNFHEEPQVLHYGSYGTGIKLRPGMIFTIEPMINIGKHYVKTMPDNWTVVTKDRSLSAQWEHTILVTETGYEILTHRSEEINIAKNT